MSLYFSVTAGPIKMYFLSVFEELALESGSTIYIHALSCLFCRILDLWYMIDFQNFAQLNSVSAAVSGFQDFLGICLGDGKPVAI